MTAPTLGTSNRGRGRLLVSFASALFATIELIHDWVSLWHDAKRVVSEWWDEVEGRADQDAFRASIRRLAARHGRAPTAEPPVPEPDAANGAPRADLTARVPYSAT